LKNLLSSFSKHSFLKNVGLIAGGTAIAQFLTLAFAPLLTRIYEPSDFGLLAIYSSVLGILSIIASLRYEMAIPLAESDSDAINIFFLSLCLIVISSLIVFLGVVLFIDEIAEILRIIEYKKLLWFIPLGVLLIGLYNICNYWAVRTKNFSKIARTKVIQSISNISFACLGFKFGATGLLLGQISSQSAGAFTLGKPIFDSDIKKEIKFSIIKSLAVRYKNFPLFSIWGGFTNTASMQLPPLIFAYTFGQTTAGLFLLANKVISLPMIFIGQAISQVFFGNAAEAHRKGKLNKLVFSIFENLSKIGGPPILFVVLLGPRLFSFVFGPAWEDAGLMASWLGPWLYFVFVTSPLSNVSTVTENQKQALIFHFINLTTRISSIAYGAYQNDLILSIILFAMSSLLCRIGYLVWITSISGNSHLKVWIQNIKTLTISIAINSPIIFLVIIGNQLSYIYFTLFGLTILMMFLYYLRLARSLLNMK
jgi:O-antigen/teichoic acid export membrane protein